MLLAQDPPRVLLRVSHFPGNIRNVVTHERLQNPPEYIHLVPNHIASRGIDRLVGRQTAISANPVDFDPYPRAVRLLLHSDV